MFAYLFHFWFNVFLKIIALHNEIIYKKFNTRFFDFKLIHP